MSVLRPERDLFLFSLRPEYAKALFSGLKKYELRRGAGSDLKRGDLAVVYVSGRIKRLFGCFEIGSVFRGSPEEVWRYVSSKRDSGVG
ncbi:MAG: ASCH domain-containing protein, partial [Fervidicoccaceae archaeon]